MLVCVNGQWDQGWSEFITQLVSPFFLPELTHVQA